jgi:hypothetical protein
MNTLVFPFPNRDWNTISSKQAIEVETHRVRNLLNKMQAHVQRNLAFMIDSERAQEPKPTQILPYMDIQPVGQSGNVLANVRECVLIKHRGRQALSAVRRGRISNPGRKDHQSKVAGPGRFTIRRCLPDASEPPALDYLAFGAQ